MNQLHEDWEVKLFHHHLRKEAIVLHGSDVNKRMKRK